MASIDDLISDLQVYTKFNTNDLNTAVCAECVNLALRRMTREHAWRFQEATTDVQVSGGPVALPDDFITEKIVFQKNTGQGDPALALVVLEHVQRLDWFKGNVSLVDPIVTQVAVAGSTNQHRGYFLWAGQLWIVPTPSTATTIQLDYYRTLPDLVPSLTLADTNDFTTDYPDVVRFGALQEAYLFLREWELAGQYEGAFKDRLARAIVHDNTVALSGPPAKRGK